MNNIAFCINSLAIGGAERIVVTLSENLRQYLNVEIICLEKNMEYTINNDIGITFLSDRKGKEAGLVKLFSLLLDAFRLKKYCQSRKIQLVQSHIFRANYVNILAKIFGSNHSAQIVIHGVINEYLKKGLLGKINLYLIRILYPHADLIIANSKGIQTEIREILGGFERIELINNPFDINMIRNKSQEQINAQEFRFKTNKKYLISVGRLIKTKRQADIILAFCAISDSHPDCDLLFLGDGLDVKKLHELVNSLDLNNRVHFIGKVKNPYKYLKKSSIFISASESESFGNVIIEAMASGCPVISSDCAYGPREILTGTFNLDSESMTDFIRAEYGLLFPVGNTDLLAKGIGFLLSNEKNRQAYIAKGLKRCLDYDLKKIIPQYEENLIQD
jgi:N-acetylgalactosamine-N,N'-diacetylbacillosaminyl-diphospho-undecaprenol 4-alpha-N-acetylgalactosaminyltransferase